MAEVKPTVGSSLRGLLSNPYVLVVVIIGIGVLILSQTDFFKGVSKVVGALGGLLVTALNALNKGLAFMLSHPWLIIGAIAGYFLVKTGIGGLSGISEESATEGAKKGSELQEKGVGDEAAGNAAGVETAHQQKLSEDKDLTANEASAVAKLEDGEAKVNDGDIEGGEHDFNEAADDWVEE